VTVVNSKHWSTSEEWLTGEDAQQLNLISSVPRSLLMHMQPCISNKLDIDRVGKDLTDIGFQYMRPEEVKLWKGFEDSLATNGKIILSIHISHFRNKKN
jgi:hypothetical protein